MIVYGFNVYIKKLKNLLQPRIELGPKRWQRSILPLNYCSLINNKSLYFNKFESIIFVFIRVVMNRGDSYNPIDPSEETSKIFITNLSSTIPEE